MKSVREGGEKESSIQMSSLFYHPFGADFFGNGNNDRDMTLREVDYEKFGY